MKSKTASVRLPKDMYEEIDSICDGIGCSRNDWIKDTLQEKLREESNNETQDQTTKQDKEEPTPRGQGTIKKIIVEDVPEPTVEDVPELRNVRIVLDPEPKQIDNSNKPPIEMVLFNGRYIPKAEVFEI